MKTTTEYFNMSKEELMKIRNEYGYTREECKLLDEGVKVDFLNKESDENTIKDEIEWCINNLKLELSEILKMTDGRISIIYN